MAWGLVQSNVGALASGMSGSLAFTTTTPQAGNLLLILATVKATGETYGTPTDTLLNTWTLLAGATGFSSSGSAQTAQIWAAKNKSTGANTVNISWNTTSTGTIMVGEFSGLVGSSVVQDGVVATQNQSGGSITNIVLPAYTPKVSGDLLISFGISFNRITAVNSPWNQVSVNQANADPGWGWMTGALAQVTANLTQNTTGGYGSIIVGIESGATAGPPELMLAGVGS